MGCSVRFWGKWLHPLWCAKKSAGACPLHLRWMSNETSKYICGGIIAWVCLYVNGVLLPWFWLAVCEGELLAYEVVYYVVLDFYLLFF